MDALPPGLALNYFHCNVTCCAVLSHSVLSNSLGPRGLQPTRFLCSWGFSRKEYCSGLPFSPPGDFPSPGMESSSPVAPALAGGFFTTRATWESESEVTQSCLTLCDPMDCSLPGSSVLGIFQAIILEWAAISFSRRSSRSRIKPGSPALQADSLPGELPGKPP